MKILLLGSTGLLGQAIASEAALRRWTIAAAARHCAPLVLDVSNGPMLEAMLEREAPDMIVNCAAIVDIDHCERDPGLAYRINARPAAIIAKWLERRSARYIHISTDHFFPFGGRTPHVENAPVSLLNEYARSKFAGERFALTSPNTLVSRTSIVGLRGWERPTFAEWALTAVLDDAAISLFEDAYTSSIDVDSFARAAFDLAIGGAVGLMNVAASEVYSKADFIRELARQSGRTLSKATSGSVAAALPHRPASLGLDVTLAQSRLGYTLPNLGDVVGAILEQHKRRSDT